jgi:glycerophosphoryl diester phosphodiesterase
MRTRATATASALAGLAALLCLAPAALASPYIHAHRGGSLVTEDGEQRPAFGEATMPAYRDSARRGFVIEIDAKLSADGVPMAIHDARLDRTTACEGLVSERTVEEIRRDCPVDIVGTSGNFTELPPGSDRLQKVPTMRQVLRLAHRRGNEVNLEVKNLPTDPDWDPTDGYASAIAAEVRRSGFPPSRLIVQSFVPQNLDVFERDPYFGLAETSLLTLRELNDAGPEVADANGYEWVSPGGPVGEAYVSRAHSLGLRVVPYTLNDPADVAAVTRAGVDAVFTDDPRMARSAVAAASPPRPALPPPPSEADCAGTDASNTVKPVRALLPRPRAPRVFAIQFKQELRHVESYETFRVKMECLVRRYVVPRMAKGRPNVIALNEDVGLMTIATGSRGAATRQIFGDPQSAPGCEGSLGVCGVAAAIAAIRTGYSRELAAYQQRFEDMQPVAGTFVAATDTFARGWMQVFSDIARRYGVYILGSNNQAQFRESTDPADISAFADPDLPRPESVYVATDGAVYNEVFMWGPKDVRREGPAPLRNVVASNKKVPVTPIEETIQISNGPTGGPDAVENLRPYRIPETKARVGFATSLPAFIYNGPTTTGFGEGLGPGVDPCADVRETYMSCLDALGTNLVMQDEANPGRWPAQSAEGAWQPQIWLSSTWRAVADPEVSFDYNVTPHLVGNLADLPFDGQSAITQRGLRGGRRCTYVGAREHLSGAPENDPEYTKVYAGRKREFLAMLPWVAPDGARSALRDMGARLAPGSGDPRENDYIESAIVADLPFPPVADRPSCKGA